MPGTGSSPREQQARNPLSVSLPICVPWALFHMSSPARGHHATFPGGCGPAAGSCCLPAPVLGTTPVLLSLPSWQMTSEVVDRVWER